MTKSIKQTNKPKSINSAHQVTPSSDTPISVLSPDMLRQYDTLEAGFAKRVIKMSEVEQKHRHKMTEYEQKARFDDARRGQYLGFIIGLVCITCGTFAAVSGAETAGSIIGGGGVIGLVSVFIMGRFSKREKVSITKHE